MKNLFFLKNDLIAHRGFHNNEIPENSLKSFEEAIKYNYSIEFDISFLKDEEIICFHDRDLKRMCGKNIKIKDSTYNDIKDFSLLNSNEKIPTFKEVLNFINSKVNLLIELKPTPLDKKTFCQKVAYLLDNYKGKFAIFSFDPFIIKWFKRNRPNYIRGIISGNYTNSKALFILKYLLKNMKFNFIAKPDFISYDLNYMPNKRLNYFQEKGITIIAYCAKNQLEFDKVKKYYSNTVFESFHPIIKKLP